MATAGFSLHFKKKHFKFDVKLEVEELSSVPFVSGILFAKARLLNGGSFKDYTNRVEVDENRVLWQKNFQFVCKLIANAATGILEPCLCRISVRKELKGGRSYQKLGYADINLAQFAGAGLTSRRYVLDGYSNKNRQDNSTLKLIIDMTLLSGDPCFKVPTQHKVQAILITDDGSGSDLHIGNKGGTSEDGAGDGALASLVSISPDPGSQSSSDLDFMKSLNVHNGTSQGHTRHVSDQSKLTSSSCVNSSPAPMHTRQSSADASLLGQNIRFMSSGSSDPAVHSGSIPRATKRSDSAHVLAVEHRLNLTRVDPNELVNELMSGIDFNDKTANEGSSGLQLYVAKDGTAVLGSTREPQPPQSFKVLPPQPTLHSLHQLT